MAMLRFESKPVCLQGQRAFYLSPPHMALWDVDILHLDYGNSGMPTSNSDFFFTKWTESSLEAVGSTENLSISLAFPLFISQWYVSFWKFPHQASHNGIFPNCVTQYTLAETLLAINCQLQPPQDTLEEDQFLLALLGGDKGIQFLQTVSVTKNNWAAIFFTLHFNDNTITV